MDAVTVDPRQVAEALGIGLLELADTMRVWAAEEVDAAAGDIRQDADADGEDLARFDERIARARGHVEAVVAVEKAWREDNPGVFSEDQ